MHNARSHRFTSKKKKIPTVFNKNTSKNNPTRPRTAQKSTAFSRIFQSTTILSRSPSHSLIMTNYGNHGSHHLSHKNHTFSPRVHNNQNNNNMSNFNMSGPFNMKSNNNNFKNFQYKKSKSIKINQNGNNHFMKSHHNKQQHQHNFNSYNGLNNFNNAANQLANMLHSELTINTSFYNNPNNYSQKLQHSQQQQQQANPVFNRKFNGKNMKKNGNMISSRNCWYCGKPPRAPAMYYKYMDPQFKRYVNHKSLGHRYSQQGNSDMMSQSLGAETQVGQRYVNRFKYIRPANVRNAAPYNTTQYIMFDYSKRRNNDQECPNEVQQFADDWNMALANGTTSVTDSLVNSNNDALISLSSKIIAEPHRLAAATLSTSLESTLASSNDSTGSTMMAINENANTTKNKPQHQADTMDNYHQLSSSL